MVYGRGEYFVVGTYDTSVVAETLIVEATAVHHLFDRQRQCGHSRAGPGRHGTAAELG